MDCRTTLAHKFRTRLGFKQYDVNLIIIIIKKISTNKNNEFIRRRKYANTV